MDIGQQLHVLAGCQSAGALPGADRLAPVRIGGHQLASLCLGDAPANGPGGAIHQDGRSVLDQAEIGGCDDARDTQLPGDDRSVAGGPAELGHQPEDLARVEPRSVGRCKVWGQQNDGLVRLRYARLGKSEDLGDDAVADVFQVGGAFCHQATELLELRDEFGDGFRRGGGGGFARTDLAGGRANPAAILRERGGGGQDFTGGPGGGGGSGGEACCDGLGCRTEALGLGRTIFLGDDAGVDRDLGRLARPSCGRVGDAGNDAGSGQEICCSHVTHPFNQSIPTSCHSSLYSARVANPRDLM